jgi:hypothetical protein
MADSTGRSPSERELRDLAALADGSLPAARRAELEARVAASPRLQSLLAEQRRALVALQARGEQAPDSLRAALAVQAGRARSRPRRLRLASGLAAVAGVALALVLALPASERGAPTVAEAAQLAARPSERPAPGPYRGHPSLLALEVEEVAYPDWEKPFGWRAVGSRSDALGGRVAQTLFYERAGRRIAYTILSGKAISSPGQARRVLRAGTELRSLALDDRAVVTWERERHTCVLSGEGVSREALLRLGAWKGGGAVPY